MECEREFEHVQSIVSIRVHSWLVVWKSCFLRIDTIILLGDIFDNWVFPHDMTPPTMQELLSAEKNRDVVEELNNLSGKCKVSFIPGNHDMHATKEIIGKFFPKFSYYEKRYTSRRLIAEHGHHYAIFNAPAGFSDNIMKLPLGYFISRIEGTRRGLTNEAGRRYQTYVDDAIEVMGKQTLPQSVMEAVIEEGKLDEEYTDFIVKTKAGIIKSIPALHVKDVYKDIYEDWANVVVSKHRAVFAELDMLGPIADKLCKINDMKVCILGHSHRSEIDKDRWFVDDRIYANTGFWCGENCTFVESEEANKVYTVSTVKWDGGQRKIVRMRTETVK